MAPRADHLTIGALAKAAGVHVETIRFYQRKGLLPTPDRPYGGIRRYGREDLARLQFIQKAKRLGFRLDEIAELLALADGSHCAEARALAERKLADVRAPPTGTGPSGSGARRPGGAL
ncbi:MAG: hypothetical protein KatS3mg124_2289 [Porticoccaceae bacterium]|nr:MAG: hypothetical protein KatS3mg124_2289 [Porticoccaceae bacterium]